MTWADAVTALLYLGAGLALGTVYFALLLALVRRHVAQAAVLPLIPLHLARLAGAAVSFWLVAQQGAMPLLMTLMGFLLARLASKRWAGAAP